jgi:ribonuclease VapC
MPCGDSRLFIDSSAFVAILTGVPDQTRLVEALDASALRLTSGLVRLETVMRTATKLNIAVEDAQAAFDRLIDECGIEVVAITDEMSRVAVDAFARFGKGRGHPAQLNLADCMAYAVAYVHQCPLLFIGKDFVHTDIVSTLPDPAPVILPGKPD